jgi:hypothetical protein
MRYLERSKGVVRDAFSSLDVHIDNQLIHNLFAGQYSNLFLGDNNEMYSQHTPVEYLHCQTALLNSYFEHLDLTNVWFPKLSCTPLFATDPRQAGKLGANEI